MNRAEEDYIKTLYELTVEKDINLIKPSELATHFGFSDQSVNEMINKLTKKSLIEFIPYKGVSLTKDGRVAAIKMIRAHRLWEVFLTKDLGINWALVHDEAESLEHASSDLILNNLDEHLGYPKYCQHGNPIPDKDGQTVKVSTKTINDLTLGCKFILVRVLDQKELLTFLDQEKINLYDEFTLTKDDSFTNLLEIKGKNKTHILSKRIAGMLFVKLI